jgi:two-component sensor histidine kinase
MLWLLRIMACRGKQPAIVRWLTVLALFSIALGARIVFGRMSGVNPSLTFYPILLVVTLFYSWLEASVVLGLSVIAGIYLFLPPEMLLLPLGWLFVGGLSIAIVGALKQLAQELALAKERQSVLFQELQHRVANTLQSVLGTLEIARKRIDTDPVQAKMMLQDAEARFCASAQVHRRLHDPSLFQQGLSVILRDAVTAVVDMQTTDVSVEVSPLHLSFDQMSIVTMIVIEAANNARKHVFECGSGRRLLVSLRAKSSNRVILSVRDDGPGWASGEIDNSDSLGMNIIRRLTDQIGGDLTVRPGSGTEVSVVFPLLSHEKAL